MHINVILQTAGWLLSPEKIGHAYLDPGSGSFILQLLLAAILGGAFLLRSYISRGFKAIRRMLGHAEPETSAEDADDEE
jgi:hypothetical protein